MTIIDENDNLSLYEARENELLLELGKLKMDDPKRGPILKELDTIASIRQSYETNEQTRLNNNARNDIEEQKLVIEQKKLENDARRTNMTGWQTGLYVFTAFFSGFMSYHMDETKQIFKWMDRQKDEFLKLIRRT